MNKIRFFLIFLFFVFLGYIIFNLTKKSGEEIYFENKLSSKKIGPDVQFSKTELKEIDENGNIIWEFKANSLKVDKIEEKTYLSEVEGIFYDNNKPSLSFKAENLVIDLKTKNFTISKVEGMREEGKLYLKSGEIKWDAKNKKILCNLNPIFKKGEISIKSDNLEADLGLKIIKFKGKTKTIISG